MAEDPHSGDVLKLAGDAERWRLRVGNYRIFFTMDQQPRAIFISAIIRRSSTTY